MSDFWEDLWEKLSGKPHPKPGYVRERCSECSWVGDLDKHLPPSGTCMNTGKVAKRVPVSG